MAELANFLPTIGTPPSSGGGVTASLTLPFDAHPGDVLFVDPLGNVKKERYPTQAIVTTTWNWENVEPVYSSTFLRARVGSIRTGPLQSHSSTSGFAVLTLSDGNLMTLYGGSASGLSYGTVAVNVMDAAMTTMHQSTQYNPMLSSDNLHTTVNLLGIREVSANVFRVWVSNRVGGSGTLRNVGYFVLTYNTVSKTVSYSAGALVLTAADVNDVRTAQPIQFQGQRYVTLTQSNIKTWCLDLQTSTIVEYTTLSGVSVSIVALYDHSSAGNEFARITYGASTVGLLKGGVNTITNLPANLASDGCFSTSNQVMLVGPRQWLCLNQSTGVVKVVAFNTDYTTCNIWGVGTNAALKSLHRVTRQGNSLVLYGSTSGSSPANTAVSFVWDGSNAPTQINISDSLFAMPATFADSMAVTDPSVKYVLFSNTYYTFDSGAGLWAVSRAFLQVDAAEYLAAETVEFATVTQGAVAGQPCQVITRGNSVQSDRAVASTHSVSCQGLIIMLHFDKLPYAVGATLDSSDGSHTETIHFDWRRWVDQVAECMAYQTLTTSGGVYFVKGYCHAATVQGPATITNCMILTALGKSNFSASSTYSTYRYTLLRSGALFSSIGSSGVYGDIPRGNR